MVYKEGGGDGEWGEMSEYSYNCIRFIDVNTSFIYISYMAKNTRKVYKEQG